MLKKKFSNTNEIPGHLYSLIPDVEDAWKEMRQQLQNELPEEKPVISSSGNKHGNRRKKYTVLLLLLFTVSWVVFNWVTQQKQGSKQRHSVQEATVQHSEPAQDIPRTDNTPRNKMMPADTSEAGNNTGHTIQEKIVNDGAEISTASEKTTNRHKANRAINNLYNPLFEKTTISNRGNNSRKVKGSSKNSFARVRIISKKKEKFNASEGTAGNSSNTIFDIIKNDKREIIQSGTDSANSAVKKVNANTQSYSDSMLTTDNDLPKKGEKEKYILTGGLQWSLQLPLYNSGSYFTGSNTNTQLYRIILPGAWIAVQADRFSVTAEANPFFNNLLPSKPFGRFSAASIFPDTIVLKEETKTVKKLFGISGGLSGNYNIAGKWWAGGGVHVYWWKNAIVHSVIQEERRAVNGSGKTITSYTSTSPLQDKDWEYFRKSEFILATQLQYRWGNWQTDLRFTIPMLPLSVKEGPGNHLRGELVFKWQLLNNNKK